MKYYTFAILVIVISSITLPCKAERRTSGINASNPTSIMSVAGSGSIEGRTIPVEPVGWLSVQTNTVRVGANPILTWAITYPSIVEDYVTIVAPSTIRASYDLKCSIRILGAGVTTVDKNKKLIFIPTEARVSYNGGNYNSIFFGTNRQVPRTVVWTTVIHKNDTIEFGGRYQYDGRWSGIYTSVDGSRNVRCMVAGDTPPSIIPTHNAPSLESFLKPYLNAYGRVDIGPMDVIVVMELTHSPTEISNPGYDLQDMVMLVTFETIETKRK